MRLLRILATLSVTLLLALTPLLFPASAYAQTLNEAESALSSGKQELIDATQNRKLADQTVSSTLTNLQSSNTDVETAQNNYDKNLISDPTWVNPTQEVEHTRLVPKTELVSKTTPVSHIETITHTNTVEVLTSVPHTTIVEHTTTTVVPGGLVAKSYNRQGYNNAPPLPLSEETPLNTENVSNIDFQWGGGQVLNSGKSEDVLVAFEGNLMVPVDGWYKFYAPGDDGIKLDIAGMKLIDDWRDKGGGGTVSEQVWIRAGIFYPTTLYYYENGGGAWVQLYYSTPASGFQVVPASWFGEKTVTETTYEEVVTWETVITYEEVVTYEDITVWEDVTTWEEITTMVEELYFTTELVPNQFAPLIKDDALLAIVNEKVIIKNIAQQNYDEAVATQAVAVSREVVAIKAIPDLEQAVIDATPVVVPPVVPEPQPEEGSKEIPVVIENLMGIDIQAVDPTELTEAQAEQLVEAALVVFETADEGSAEYEQALDALYLAAEQDDIVVDEALANIPGVGQAAVAIANVLNAIGNVGADISPKARKKAQNLVVTTLVVGQIAQTAALATASGGSSSSNRINRRK